MACAERRSAAVFQAAAETPGAWPGQFAERIIVDI
jgi:hypothetical protein